jgi:hypothetical protein
MHRSQDVPPPAVPHSPVSARGSFSTVDIKIRIEAMFADREDPEDQRDRSR